MSDNTATAVEVEAKPVKEPKVATACACSEFSAMIDGVNVSTACSAQTVNKFGPGHDAKLKSLLIKAAVANAEVTKTGLDGSFEGLSAYEAADLHGFGEQVKKSAEARIAKRDASESKKADAATKKAQADEVKAAAKVEREARSAAKKEEQAEKKAAAARAKAEAKAAKEAAAAVEAPAAE